MESDSLSTLTRLVEARVQIQQAYEAIPDDRPELAASLEKLMADVDELRWILSEEEAPGQAGANNQQERTESEGGPT